MKKTIALILSIVLIMAISFPSAAASQTAVKKPVKQFSLLMFGDWYKSGWVALDKYIQNNSSKLGFKFNIEKIAGGSQGNQIIATRFAAGDSPDFVEYYSVKEVMNGLGGLGNIAPIDGAWTKNYPDSVIKSPIYSHNGKTYGLPIDTAVLSGVFYNKKVYSALGLKIPTTWNQFMANCEKVKAAGKTPVFFSCKDGWTTGCFLNDWMFQEYAKSSEKAVIDGINTNKIDVSQLSEIKNGLNKFKELFDKQYVNPTYLSDTYDMAQKALAEGTAAHYILATWVIDEIAKKYPDKVNDIGAFPLPAGTPQSNGITMFSPFAFFMSSNISDKAEGMKVINWLASDEAQTILSNAQPGVWTQKNLKPKYFPAQQDTYDMMKAGKSHPFYNDPLKYWLGWDNIGYASGAVTLDKVMENSKADFIKQAVAANDPNFVNKK